jgi:hypothetical protein
MAVAAGIKALGIDPELEPQILKRFAEAGWPGVSTSSALRGTHSNLVLRCCYSAPAGAIPCVRVSLYSGFDALRGSRGDETSAPKSAN